MEFKLNDEFYTAVNAILYENKNGMEHLKQLSGMHDLIKWVDFVKAYMFHRYGDQDDNNVPEFTNLAEIQKSYVELKSKLSYDKWVNDEYRQEMLIAAEGICVIAELLTKAQGGKVERITDTKEWLEKYSAKWMDKNKRSELYNIEEMFNYCEENF